LYFIGHQQHVLSFLDNSDQVGFRDERHPTEVKIGNYPFLDQSIARKRVKFFKI